jgi:predicted nucleotidyltransferase
LAGETAKIKLFGSRIDDTKKGGDIDLLITLDQPIENPALLAARMAAVLTRAMQGRKVDVLLMTPNLKNKTYMKLLKGKGKAYESKEKIRIVAFALL